MASAISYFDDEQFSRPEQNKARHGVGKGHRDSGRSAPWCPRWHFDKSPPRRLRLAVAARATFH